MTKDELADLRDLPKDEWPAGKPVAVIGLTTLRHVQRYETRSDETLMGPIPDGPLPDQLRLSSPFNWNTPEG